MNSRFDIFLLLKYIFMTKDYEIVKTIKKENGSYSVTEIRELPKGIICKANCEFDILKLALHQMSHLIFVVPNHEEALKREEQINSMEGNTFNALIVEGWKGYEDYISREKNILSQRTMFNIQVLVVAYENIRFVDRYIGDDCYNVVVENVDKLTDLNHYCLDVTNSVFQHLKKKKDNLTLVLDCKNSKKLLPKWTRTMNWVDIERTDRVVMGAESLDDGLGNLIVSKFPKRGMIPSQIGSIICKMKFVFNSFMEFLIDVREGMENGPQYRRFYL